jgi:hypothetical protein
MTPWNLSNILEAPLEGLRRMTSEPISRSGGYSEQGAERNRSPFHKRQQANHENEDTIEFHCNYEQNCTSLFKKIEKQEWSSVDKFLASGIWPDTSTIDALSPDEQARTWVSRFDPRDPGQCRWSLLPVHLVCNIFVQMCMLFASFNTHSVYVVLQASILGAPYTTITRLVELHPEPARADGINATIPHLAKRSCGSNRVIDSLFSASLDIFSVKGATGTACITPLKTCAEIEAVIPSLRMQIEEKTRELSQDLEARAKLRVMCKLNDIRVDIKQEELKKMIDNLKELESRSLEPLPLVETEEKSVVDDLVHVPSYAASLKSISPDYCLQAAESCDALASTTLLNSKDGKSDKNSSQKRDGKLFKQDSSSYQSKTRIKNLEDHGYYIFTDVNVKSGRHQRNRVSFKGKDSEHESQKEEREPPNTQRRPKITDTMKRIRRGNLELDNNEYSDRTQFPCMK